MQQTTWTRRSFIGAGLATTVGTAFWRANDVVLVAAKESSATPSEVKIVQFSDKGEKLASVKVPVVVKSDAEWKQQLTPAAYQVARHAATETPFTGRYWNNHDKGLYRCVCCDTALFESDTKFESGTGWPSFWQPIAKENVHEISDSSLDMQRIAVSCRLCEAHLGHVFDDGPKPTYLRYCMNSVSLKFVKFDA